MPDGSASSAGARHSACGPRHCSGVASYPSPRSISRSRSTTAATTDAGSPVESRPRPEAIAPNVSPCCKRREIRTATSSSRKSTSLPTRPPPRKKVSRILPSGVRPAETWMRRPPSRGHRTLSVIWARRFGSRSRGEGAPPLLSMSALRPVADQVADRRQLGGLLRRWRGWCYFLSVGRDVDILRGPVTRERGRPSSLLAQGSLRLARELRVDPGPWDLDGAAEPRDLRDLLLRDALVNGLHVDVELLGGLFDRIDGALHRRASSLFRRPSRLTSFLLTHPP